jgi:hypothetical protein
MRVQSTRAGLSFLKADMATRLELYNRAKTAAGRIGEDGSSAPALISMRRQSPQCT